MICVAAAIRDDTALVSVMFANNEIGTLQPIQAIGTQPAHKGGRIEVKAATCTNGRTPANALVGHVSAVSQLNSGSSAFSIDRKSVV